MLSTRIVALLALPGILAAMLAACGEKSDPETGSQAVPSAEAVTSAEVPDGTPFIDQQNLKFIPNSLVVKAGSAIYFKNSETAIHTVTVNRQNISGHMKRDEVIAWTPVSPGVYRLTCDFHPQMKATITVE